MTGEAALKQPKALVMLKRAISLGFKVDVETGEMFRPDGSKWTTGFNSGGYLHVQGSKAMFGEHFCIPVHKAVGYMKFGDAAFGGHSVHIRHLDGNKLNNRGSNIEIGTPSENAQDKPMPVRSGAGKIRAQRLGPERLKCIASKGHSKVDWVAAGRKSAESAGSKLLTDIEVAMIRKNATLPKYERMSQRVIAKEFGVTQGTVCDILAGRCYGNVALEFQ